MSSSKSNEFKEGQRIEVNEMIEGDPPVPPGVYAVAEVRHSLLGNSYRIRSMPNEDIDAEVDHATLERVAHEA